MKISKLVGVLLVCVVVMVTALPVLAEYPERPISLIVAAAPGGGTDVMARALVPFLEKYLGGATFTVINKPGAGTEIGATALAQAKPDGYTIGMTNSPHMLAIPIERKAAFNMLESFVPMANLVTDAAAFNVRSESQFKTLDDLVAYAKENPGIVTVGTSGIGGDDHLAMLMFERVAGIKLTHVPFPSGAPNRAAMLGGHIDIGSFNVSEAIEYVKEGKVRCLGVMANKRWEMAPDIPTFKEQGYDVLMDAGRGIAAPAGIPEDRLAKLQDALDKAIADKEFVETAKKMKIPMDYVTGPEYIESLKAKDAELRAIWESDPWKK